MNIPECDQLRTPGTANQSDSRLIVFKKMSEGEEKPLALSDYYLLTKDLVLNEFVPMDIRIQFETTKNLFLYSWFVYRFSTVAQTHAYSVLEFALKEKADTEEIEVENLALGKLLDIAFKHNWLSEPTGTQAKQFIKGLRYLRNELAHGSATLAGPAFDFSQVQLCSELINQLFQNNSKKAG